MEKISRMEARRITLALPWPNAALLRSPSLTTNAASGNGGGISVGKLGEERGIHTLCSKQRLGSFSATFSNFFQGIIGRCITGWTYSIAFSYFNYVK